MNKFQQSIIKTALDEPEKLSEWENEFCNNLADKPDDYELSEKQNKIVNRISQKFN